LVEAARLVLPHRLDGGLANPERTAARLAEVLAGVTALAGLAALPEPGGNGEEPATLLENMDFPGSAAAGSMLFTYLKKKVLTASSPPATASC
jgi:magnesium chelatase subunit D/magnesium chelatase subunit I